MSKHDPIVIQSGQINVSYPKLSGVLTPDLIQTIGTGKYSASYVNWSRTMELLRQHADGWLPFMELAPDERSYVHPAPVGGYLMIGFRHADGRKTPTVPQAIMDHKNIAIPFDQISARDITDTHRRGICLASALFFGLAYELWAKVDVEDPYKRDEAKPSAPEKSFMTQSEALDALDKLTTPDQCRALYKTLTKEVQQAVTENFMNRVKQLEDKGNE